MKSVILLAFMGMFTGSALAAEMITPADMPEPAQQKMYSLITDYNRCVMQSRLQTSQNGQDAQAAVQDILQSCETKLDELTSYLAANQVDESLTAGMTKKLRSRAARQLMARTMNNLDAQAAALINAEKKRSEK